MNSSSLLSFVVASAAIGLVLGRLWRAKPSWPWLERNSSVIARWALLALAVVLSCFFTLIVALGLSGSLFYVVSLPAAALFVLMCVRIAPSLKRPVAVSACLAAALFLVQCAPYPNLGLPFGYWGYPNRAINAFLECQNVESAVLGGWNKDVTLEEFRIDVSVTDQHGGRYNLSVPFNQYPTREEIKASVARIGCHS